MKPSNAPAHTFAPRQLRWEIDYLARQHACRPLTQRERRRLAELTAERDRREQRQKGAA